MNIAQIAAAVAVVAGVLTAAPAAAQADPADARVWYQPGADQFTASNLWRFDFSTGSGYKRSLQPSLTGWGIQRQTTFSFEKSGAEYTVRTFEYGSTWRITGLSYDRSADTWVVNNNGFIEKWYGCRSAGRPLSGAVAC